MFNRNFKSYIVNYSLHSSIYQIKLLHADGVRQHHQFDNIVTLLTISSNKYLNPLE